MTGVKYNAADEAPQNVTAVSLKVGIRCDTRMIGGGAML